MSSFPTQYAQITDLQSRFDMRQVAQLSNDVNSTGDNTLNENNALADATSIINTSLMVGGQYSATEIAGLVASGDTTLQRLCCTLAMKYLYLRRGSIPESFLTETKWADELLTNLVDGKKVLNIQQAIAASLPLMVNLSPTQNMNVSPMSNIQFFGGPEGTQNTSGQYSVTGTGSGGYGSGAYNNL